MTKDDPPPKEAAPATDTGKTEAAAAPEPAGQSSVFLKYILVGVVAMLAYRGVEEMSNQSTAVPTPDGKEPAVVDGPRVADGEPPIVLEDHQVLIQHCVS
mmetsp:Transcript_16969/g.40866  ORF Transcript_16969/g.40866 Transcript_16969/m.40866 type:complete len:100 (-) Transcript_16969:770-1069(-)